MANLVVLKFDTPDGADKGLALAESLQKQQLLQIIDAATVIWPDMPLWGIRIIDNPSNKGDSL